MSDREIAAELPDGLRRQAEFTVAVGEAPSVAAYVTDRLGRRRESMDEVFARWDREQGVTPAERADAEALVRQRMAADDARWADLHSGGHGQPSARRRGASTGASLMPQR